MSMGVEQLKRFLHARLEQPEGASYRSVEEPYEEFLKAMAPSEAELTAQREHPPLSLPRFSLLLAGDWDGAAKERTLASVAAQTYSRFEIALDPKHIEGDYVLYLWPGDVLSPEALYHYARAAGGGADLIYADEDLAPSGQDGARREPFLKSAPSRLTQMSYDMLSCGVAAQLGLFRKVGGMAGDTPEDRYAYNLRCLCACRRAVHIPRPLYTLSADRRPGPQGIRAVKACLGRGETVSEGQWPGSFRVERLEKKKPAAALIIPNLNGAPALRRLLESVEAQTLYPYSRILIADLGSHDDQTLRYYSLLEKNKAAQVVYGEGARLSKILNRAAQDSNAEALVFLGRDVEIVSPGWLDSLLSQLYRPGVGAAGGKLVDARGRVIFSGGVAGIGGWTGSFYTGAQDGLESLRQNRFVNSIRSVSILSLWCMALRSPVFWNAGGFDESFERDGLDMELCLRLGRRGHACVYTPYALLRCHAALPSLANASEQDQIRCYDALRDTLLWGDPHCSPNYDFQQTAPLVASAPRPAIEHNGRYCN